MTTTIRQLAELAARHKLVPFLGAGCSVRHLAHDWNSIVREMAAELASGSTDHLQIAEEYVQKCGQNGLVAFLRDRLLVRDYLDEKGTSHLAMLGLNIGLIYTTNQDNVFEKCCEKYGRTWRRIVALEDLSRYRPGEPLYIKYHGDLDVPESVVFAKSHYEERTGDREHFLNIRLKSDLLAKQLLFIGYSLRDDTVKGVLGEIASLFGGKLPHSYLVAYNWTPELDAACAPFNVEVINPSAILSDARTAGEALDRFVSELCNQTMRLKSQEEIGMLFDGATPPSLRVATRFEIDALKAALPQMTIVEGAAKFRATFDDVVIPKEFEQEVAELLILLCQRCSTEEESDSLDGTLFNLHLTEAALLIEVAAAVMATANIRSKPDLFKSFHIIVGDVGEMASVITAARATELLDEWNREISEPFQYYVSDWFDHSTIDLDSLPDDTTLYVSKWADAAWRKRTILEHPLKRQLRLKELPNRSSRKAPSFKEVQKRFTDSWPTQFRKPTEE